MKEKKKVDYYGMAADLILAVAFILISTNCASLGETTMKREPPFELILASYLEPLSQEFFIRVSLKNISNQPQPYLSTGGIQLPTLSFVSGRGDAVEIYDRRPIEEQSDPHVYKKMIKIIAPQEVATLMVGVIQKSDDSFKVPWGPLEYRKIRAGSYQVDATWQSAISQCRETKGGRDVPIKNIWLGEINSDPIDIEFPIKTIQP